jgi:hypothetical protein
MSLVINPYLFTPIFETAGYTRLWAVTAQSSGNITGSAETDTGYYAVKWWDDSVDVYDSGDPFSKAAAGSLRVFEVYPSDVSGDPSGDFDGFDISDNSLTQVRSEGVTLASSGGAQTGGYFNTYYGYWAWGPYFSPIVAENGIISDNLLTAEALDQFYTDLDSGTGSLFVSGNLGIDTDDPTIATAKGYAVFGSVPPGTALLLNFNGSNGSTTFTDSSPNELTVTASGDAEISTAESKFGGASGYFDGATSYIIAESGDALQFGVEDFSVEMWVRFDATSNALLYDTIPIDGPGSRSEGFALVLQDGQFNVFHSGSFQGSPSVTASTGQWYHIAFTRSGGLCRLFVDGQVDSSFTLSVDISDTVALVGRVGNAAAYFLDGYIDDLRVVKGFALYTANFTPPTSQLGVYP